MSFHWCDNLHTMAFSPRDYQVELLAAAYEHNIMICLGHKSSKEFIALKLLQEITRKSRRKRSSISIYLSRNKAPIMYTMLLHLTNLRVFQETSDSITELPKDYVVYILHPKTMYSLMKSSTLNMSDIDLLILEDCHQSNVLNDIIKIFSEFYENNILTTNKPRILGLAGPLHSAGCDLSELSAMVNTLEQCIHCKTETSSDIVTVLRYCAKPHEYLLQCAPFQQDELSALLEDVLLTRKAFLNDHRYDPFEIYNTEEFLEELKEIPDPKKEPLELLNIILKVLKEMGPWCADRVALNMYHRIEKQKIKTPHERHYILLCLVNTALLEFHAICEQEFLKYHKTANHKSLVYQYSSPKVLRLLEVLYLFKPVEKVSSNQTINVMSTDLEQIDFSKMTRILETKCHSLDLAVEKQQFQSRSIVDNLDSIVERKKITNIESAVTTANNKNTSERTHQKKTDVNTYNLKGCNIASTSKDHKARRIGGHLQNNRLRYRSLYRRNNRDMGDSADLCAIIFCNCNYTARVLFDLLAEMSRQIADYKFIKCQFTTDRVANPLTEPKEAELEHRRQEDVLKRFRTHDCNVLVATSILEEGIDVPKCNLVVRWDPPTTYRSYVQCKGRARSVPGYHIILVAATSDNDNNNHVSGKIGSVRDQLNERSHLMICGLDKGQDNTYTDSDNSDSNDEKLTKKSKHSLTYECNKGIVKILNPEVITNKPPITNLSCNDLILKEIKDEIPTIENINDLGDVNFKKEGIDVIDSIIKKKSIENQQIQMLVTTIDDEKEFDNTKNDIGVFQEIEINEKVNRQCGEDEAKEIDFFETSKLKNSRKKFTCCLEKNLSENENNENCIKSSIKNTSLEKQLQAMESSTTKIVQQMAEYREIEKMLLLHCANNEPSDYEHRKADIFNKCITPYKPLPHLLTGASVDLSNSIALVNKYCAKLPSDSFTKLTPLWRCARTTRNEVPMYQYTIRLPINSPLQYDIVGLPMPSQVLARRMAALQACIALHKCGELDDNLQPIGKEGFKAIDSDWEVFDLEEQDAKIVQENSEPRPGTTKRRQYYYKRIANEFCECRPIPNQPCYLYLLDLTLQCPIPEEQNTRGRKIYPPEDALQGFGILTLKKIPKVSAFPIFTRSGEVQVSLVLHPDPIILNEEQIKSINIFINYTFTKVLRLKKFLMLFDPESTENCVFIVPTIKTFDGNKHIDWAFLKLIENNANMMPTSVPEKDRHVTEFNAEKFKDAVVMPWYRNQDHPHFFYVAEICYQLSPLSVFPSKKYLTFMHYYYLKYGLKIHPEQPLLDVDHTSARLNFLTPRYVNRKGVALPTSSEATKRAKRENLELKQILVPELCTIHPFPASLWRTAVCLPCILYRINGLLLADDIRKKVVNDIGLGQIELPEDKFWPKLDFGWCLKDVFNKKSCIKRKNEQENNNDDDNSKTKAECNNVHSEFGQSELRSLNEIVEDAELKLHEKCDGFVEIGTWSNEMISNTKMTISDSDSENENEFFNDLIPSTIKFCKDSESIHAVSPTFTDIQLEIDKTCSVTTQNNGNKHLLQQIECYDTEDDDDNDSLVLSSLASYDDYDDYDSYEDDIEFTSKNEAENIETEQDIEKFNKQLSIIQATKENELNYQQTKNQQIGYDFFDLREKIANELKFSIEKYNLSVIQLVQQIETSEILVAYNKPLQLLEKNIRKEFNKTPLIWESNIGVFKELLSYLDVNDLQKFLQSMKIDNNSCFQSIDVEILQQLDKEWRNEHPYEMYEIMGYGNSFDNFYNNYDLLVENDKNEIIISDKSNDNYKFHHQENKINIVDKFDSILIEEQNNCSYISINQFSFDAQPDLSVHPGPSPSIILQALTMSNANDGINLERLETIGDSFLKYAITTYLYITYENVHEGKLSHLRSKQVANLNLYRLGKRKQLGEYMIATKFEPNDNWLPPCYYVPKELEKALIEAKIPPQYWSLVDLANIKKLTNTEICDMVRQKADEWGLNFTDINDYCEQNSMDGLDDIIDWTNEFNNMNPMEPSCFIPYNLVSQHSIPDKSVADCVEALIGAYLIECGPRGALLFMAWLGIRVLPYKYIPFRPDDPRLPGSTLPDKDGKITVYGSWSPPKSPLIYLHNDAEEILNDLLAGYDQFERTLNYKFRDKSYLLQAMTHASYTPNRLTDCYQRLEFLGDAVLDYLVTRHLYEDPRQHSPGALTDLRSALVNNTIFASLAVRYGFHKYFRHLSPGLNEVIDRFVRIQIENGHSIKEDCYLLTEEECDDAEDVEVPKALGDVFESVAGAIFLDSNMSLDEVWRVYSHMMQREIELFSNSVPKSPIRELLELEPETAKFGKPEKLADGRRVRVTVEVFCKGTFRGVGRNYRIAKCTAAKCALRQLKKKGLIGKTL